MLGACRHRFVAGTIALLLSAFLPGSGYAQETRILANCGAPRPAADAAPATASATVSCEVRANDAAAVKGAKAFIKGRGEPLEATFTAFDPQNRSLAALFLVQNSEATRRGNVLLMADAVTRIADAREGKRRFAAYTFDNDLNAIADFNASKADFDKQVRAIKSVTLPSQLYRATLEAIGKLAKEPGDRKALIILGDGSSDDTSYDHAQVVKAAKEAGVVIHALGYLAEAADLPKFQTLQRLADDTGGFRRDVRVGGVQKYALGKQLVGEVLENGGTLSFSLKEPPGPVTVSITADLGSGRSASVDQSFTLAAPSSSQSPSPRSDPSLQPTPVAPPEAASLPQRLLGWMKNNKLLAAVIGLGIAAALIGLGLLAFSGLSSRAPEPAPALEEKPQVVYGWLDMLDGNASRYPLRTTNVRIGRHRDNDICLQNDSISRRHAVVHFNANNRRFVITDLGGDNGVIVNKVKQQSHELNDGDLVELGEVRLRFRANMEHMR
jgi:FHA domain-containing protein/von Willebrand factor type A domain-containing protein